MAQVFLFSGLIVAGMILAQVVDLSSIRAWLTPVTMACLAYIMIGVGLEFVIDKRNLKQYGVDYLVAAIAAALPWLLCAGYFVLVFGTEWKEALLVGRFAAPTSAGILLSMLAAAGLGATWLYRKTRVLVIFDDLDTVLFMIPLQMLYAGPSPSLFGVLGVILLLLGAAYRWLHQLRWPAGRRWLVLYGVLLAAGTTALERLAHVHLEVLLPAFVLGCLLADQHDEQGQPSEQSADGQWMDVAIKSLFMFLVGASIPRLEVSHIGWAAAILHVLALTALSNLGKCFPVSCYRGEATVRQRWAVSIAMFPRGEVGAGVLLIALSYGLTGLPVTLSGLSLALNLVLTGVFIVAVKSLIPSEKS